MENLSELERIAKDITSAAKFITAHCDLNFVPHVSLAPDGPDSSVLRKAPVNVQKARQTLISAAMKIQQLATEPTEYLPSLAAQVRRRSSPALAAPGRRTRHGRRADGGCEEL
jgi:6-hydroxytryprostatin B O-methyltransferase